MFLLTQHFMPKSATFQNNGKNDSLSGAWAPPRGTILLSEILILVSSIWYLSMVKKAEWFFDGKNLILQNSKVENFKNLEILPSTRDFCNFLQVRTFDTFTLAYWNFLHMFCTVNTTGKQRIKPSCVYSKASSFNKKIVKKWNLFYLWTFFTNFTVY